MACRWAGSTAPLAAWIGDSDLVPHLLSMLREGAIDVEVHFGEPVEFNAAKQPQGGGPADGRQRPPDGRGGAARSAPADAAAT